MLGRINGKPTKDFFVSMITRDINIEESILDLLDNSIDGANRINNESYQGLFVKITLNKNEFILEDNCGGFSLETATKYAFRFGRPPGMVAQGGSVGRFGVGMKRALFKIGNLFEVESKSDSDHFQVDVDVNEWKEKIIKNEDPKDTEINEDWSFDYVLVNDDNRNLETKGTFIKVTNLHQDVVDQFEDIHFKRSLTNAIENLLSFSLEKGIKISLNGKDIIKKDIRIFTDQTSPYQMELEKNGVKYKVIAGLGETGHPDKAGWYIYCNERLVLTANQNEITGWGVNGNPKFKSDFAMFRGVVFMEAEETIKLPLTTTKKGIDSSSASYRFILPFMNSAMWDVLSFLKKVRKFDDPNSYRLSLQDSQSKSVSIVNLKSNKIEETKKFIPPSIDLDKLAEKSDYTRIAFNYNKEKVESAKKHFGAKTYKQLGEGTFEYYLKMEGLDYE